MNLTFAKVIKAGGSESQVTWKRAADGMASWLDNQDFSSRERCIVQRRKWNFKSTRMGFSREACDFEIEPESRVSANEVIIDKEDAKRQ